jgi:hypothetical protein
MGKRGRTSAAALQIAGPKVIDVVDRLKAPHDLTDEETEYWAAVVNSEPADKFTPACAPLLAQLCRHYIASRRIAELIERATGDPELVITDYHRLLTMQREESKVLATLMRQLRLSPHSTTNHRGNKKAITARRPWEG